MNDENTRSANDNPPRDAEDLSDMEVIGSVSEPPTYRQRTAATGQPIDELPHAIEGRDIEGKRGDYIFTVGNPGSGKSTIQSYLIHRLWTDTRLILNYVDENGNKDHDAYLNGWVHNISQGIFPQRSKVGVVREFNIEFTQTRRAPLALSFIEIAGERIRSIVPTTESDSPRKLDDHLDRYLRERGVNRRFIFISDASVHQAGHAKTNLRYEEDILFKTLLDYLGTIKSGMGMKRMEILFIASKWDLVKKDYKSERHYFNANFPATLSTVRQSPTIRASFMAFSVGEVRTEEVDGEKIARITRKETAYVDTLISWIYESFKQRPLDGFPRVKKSLWDKIKQAFS